MKKLKALYIEDQEDNQIIYGDMFRDNGFLVYPIQPLPKDINEYYDYILKNEIDFVIIDNELKTQVTYSGLDVLKNIREQDNNIFIVLLTSYEYEEYKEALGELDYAIKKDDFNVEAAKILSKKIKRAYQLGEDIKVNNELEKEIEKFKQRTNQK